MSCVINSRLKACIVTNDDESSDLIEVHLCCFRRTRERAPNAFRVSSSTLTASLAVTTLALSLFTNFLIVGETGEVGLVGVVLLWAV